MPAGEMKLKQDFNNVNYIEMKMGEGDSQGQILQDKIKVSGVGDTGHIPSDGRLDKSPGKSVILDENHNIQTRFECDDGIDIPLTGH